MSMDVHVRDLRYFVAVAEELSFSRAAERLYVSQPTLSKQIRALERSLQTALFERQGRSIELTDAGGALLERARELVGDWDGAQRELREVASQQAATIVVGIQTGVGRGLTARAQEILAERRPAASLRFRQVGWDDPTAGLDGGETDTAILWLPLVDRSRFSAEVLITEPRLVLMSPDHRLAERDEVTPEELRGESFLALPSSAGALRDFWLGIDGGLSPARIGAEIRSADEAFEAVATGAGVVLVAAGNARHYDPDGVVARPVRGLAPAQLAVAWRSDDARALVSDFVSACTQAAVTVRSAA
jgi:DNA-binding transcriptional LysR family regulator